MMTDVLLRFLAEVPDPDDAERLRLAGELPVREDETSRASPALPARELPRRRPSLTIVKISRFFSCPWSIFMPSRRSAFRD